MNTFTFIISNLLFWITIAVLSFLIFRYFQNRRLKDTKNLEEIIRKKGNEYIKKSGSLGLVIGVVKEDRVFVEGFGRENKQNEKTPNEKTLFELASVVKVFTTSGIQILVDKGEIAWEDTIDKYLPKDLKLCEKAKQITLFQLATHTSGLPRFPESFFTKVTDKKNPYKYLATQDVYDYLASCKENSKVG